MEAIQSVLQEGMPDHVVDAAVADAPTPAGTRRRQKPTCRFCHGQAGGGPTGGRPRTRKVGRGLSAKEHEMLWQPSLAGCTATSAGITSMKALSTPSDFLAREACMRELMQRR